MADHKFSPASPALSQTSDEPTTLGTFETPDELTDITFVVEDRKLYFVKAILSVCSDVFSNMFTLDFKEKEAKEVPLPGESYEDMTVFCEQLHPKYFGTPITDKTLEQILPLADKYQVESLRQKCEMSWAVSGRI